LKIELTQGKHAIIDDEDYELVTRRDKRDRNYGKPRKWHYAENGLGRGHARSCRYLYYKGSGEDELSRFIMGITDGVVDHINGDPLDNRRSNLRICTMSENTRNQKKSTTKFSSRFKGVSWSKERKLWKACIWLGTNNFHIGAYVIEEQAARAYNEAAKKHYGEFARLNEI